MDVWRSPYAFIAVSFIVMFLIIGIAETKLYSCLDIFIRI